MALRRKDLGPGGLATGQAGSLSEAAGQLSCQPAVPDLLKGSVPQPVPSTPDTIQAPKLNHREIIDCYMQKQQRKKLKLLNQSKNILGG